MANKFVQIAPLLTYIEKAKTEVSLHPETTMYLDLIESNYTFYFDKEKHALLFNAIPPVTSKIY